MPAICPNGCSAKALKLANSTATEKKISDISPMKTQSGGTPPGAACDSAAASALTTTIRPSAQSEIRRIPSRMTRRLLPQLASAKASARVANAQGKSGPNA